MKILRLVGFIVAVPLFARISLAQNVEIIGGYSTHRAALDIHVLGNYAYVADGDSGLLILDISQPAHPALEGSFKTQAYATAIDIQGDYSYLVDYEGLKIINISNPATPELAATYFHSWWLQDVFIQENYAYIADWDSTLLVIDISDPSSPSLVGNCDTPGSPTGIYVLGIYTCMAEVSNLEIFNISDPTSPILIGGYQTGWAWDVYVLGNYAYLAVDTYGIMIIDISDPTNPVLAGSYDTPGQAFAVYVSDNYAYVADGSSGLQIINVFDPTQPTLAASSQTAYSARYVHCANNYIYVADFYDVEILRFTPTGIKDDNPAPKAFSLSQNYPNPFNAQTSISYSLAKEGQVNISIYNLLGQNVATISDGIQQAGAHAITWDAKDCPSGVYFAKLESEGQSKNIKMVLLK